MRESLLQNKTVQIIIRLVTALSFTLFTAYQIYLAVIMETSRIGRLIGIGLYVLIVVASFLDFSDKYSVWIAHSVLLVAGLVLLFIMRLLNAGTIFRELDFAVIPSVLDAAVYILSQLGTLILAAGYLMLRADLTQEQMQKLTAVLMYVAIALYALCFIAECVLIIKYRVNVELNRKYTLLSRLLYFIGFAGTALCFILPAPTPEPNEPEAGKYIYSEAAEDEIDLII